MATLYQNEELLGAILDNMPTPVMVKDINDGLKYIFWNRHCEELCGQMREEIIGKTDLDIYGIERGSYYRKVDEALLAGNGTYSAQETFELADGLVHTTLVKKNVIANKSHRWLLVTRWDISDQVKVQNELREANEQLRTAFRATMSVPVQWDITTDFVTLKFEEFKSQYEGFKPDVHGRTMAESCAATHPDDREQLIKLTNDLREGRIDTGNMVVRYDINGQFKEFYELYLTIEQRDANGKPQRIIGVLSNITESKHRETQLIEIKENLEQIQNNNQLILNNINSGLSYLAPNFMVRWSNLPKAFPDCALAAQYTTGACCPKAFSDSDAPCPNCAAARAMQTGTVVVRETMIEKMNMRITATPVFDNYHQLQGVVLKYDDVTQEREAARQLQAAKESAETSDRLKSLFLSNMSHEIRTPLNAILGFSGLLIDTTDHEEQKEFVTIINRNSDLLLQLINDILDLSKIEANTLEFKFEDIDINELLHNVELSSNCKEHAENVAIKFTTFEPTCILHTDGNRLLQIFTNLLGNAIKFTDEGSIHFGYHKEADFVQFFVTDTGRGIPQAQQGEVFKRFVKLNGFVSGTGLGLAICQNIVHKLGGEITVESEEGKGSTFRFTLPLTK
ncbi:MAG: PAS domain-containing sensor histidine kinase [Alistipes sp.]